MPVRPRKRPAEGKSASAPRPGGADNAQRLQKVLAAAGVASRRACEQLILEGRIEVDHQVVSQLGTKVNPDRQEIRVDGTPLPRVRHVYYLVNKPKGVVSTNRDPSGRPRVVDMVPETAGRVFTVGRLDRESEGLILVTNDGELANRLAHPRYGVAKKYHVQVAGFPDREVLNQLRHGVFLSDMVVKAEGVRVRRRHKQSTILEIELREGRNREIRRMLAAVGHKVQRLTRVAIGPLTLGNSHVGEVRMLTRDEVTALRAATGMKPGGRGRRRRR